MSSPEGASGKRQPIYFFDYPYLEGKFLALVIKSRHGTKMLTNRISIHVFLAPTTRSLYN
jgi:hypothetical protein